MRACLLISLLLPGCAGRIVRPQTPISQSIVHLATEPLHLRLIHSDAGNRTPVLVLFATGDGGWRRLDQEVFSCIGNEGFAAAGFNSSEYLKAMHEVSDITTPPRLSTDIARIVEFAESSLGLPADSRIVLVGVSRGAGLLSIAAGQPNLQAQIDGIIPIGLAEIEDHVRHRRASAKRSEWVAIETYRDLRRLVDLPIEIIQSTHDKYTSAERARILLGPDTALHHLYSIEADNHSFGGALPAVLERLKSSLQELVHRH